MKAARKTGDMLVAAFDGTPELVELIKSGDIVGAYSGGLPRSVHPR